MLQDMIETSYFEVTMPDINFQVANIFSFYNNLGKCALWKKSKMPLRIFHKGKVIAELSSWEEIRKIDYFKRVMNPSNNEKGNWTWLPTWNLYTSNFYKLYDESYGQTNNGKIKTLPYKNDVWSDPKKIIGEIGERNIKNYYKSNRSWWFDDKKDGTIQVLTYEVKTHQLNVHGNETPGFWVSENQSQKLDGVDILFFIQVPDKEGDSAICYVCVNHKTCWKYAYCNDGQRVRNYPLTNCLYQFTINEDDSKIILEQSKLISKWRK